jgi:hypothetical protein
MVEVADNHGTDQLDIEYHGNQVYLIAMVIYLAGLCARGLSSYTFTRLVFYLEHI